MDRTLQYVQIFLYILQYYIECNTEYSVYIVHQLSYAAQADPVDWEHVPPTCLELGSAVPAQADHPLNALKVSCLGENRRLQKHHTVCAFFMERLVLRDGVSSPFPNVHASHPGLGRAIRNDRYYYPTISA